MDKKECDTVTKSKNIEQIHPLLTKHNPISHIIALGLEDVKKQSDTVLCRGNQLPDAVLVWGVLSGPPGTGYWTVQLGDETSTSSCMERHKDKQLDTHADVQTKINKWYHHFFLKGFAPNVLLQSEISSEHNNLLKKSDYCLTFPLKLCSSNAVYNTTTAAGD